MNLGGPSITENICGYLRARIISGELSDGENINENKLSVNLGVSRPPLREALRKLEEEHLVYSIPRKGAYVRKLSVQDLDEVYQARECIEYGAVEFFESQGVRKFPDLDLFLCESRELCFTSLNDSKTRLLYRERIADFHVKLVQQTRNFRIIHFYQTLYFNLARYQYLYFSSSATLEHSRREHERILSSLKKGAYRKAREQLRNHIRIVWKNQRNILLKGLGK